MTLKDEITSQANEIFSTAYEITDARSVPSRASLTFGPTARKLWARVLYIDLRKSRALLAQHSHRMSVRAHKAFLYAVSKCVRAEAGEPRGFAGDSVLSFFPGSGEEPAKHAVRAAMKTKWALEDIVNPIVKRDYKDELNFGMGVAQGEMHVGKGGIAGDDELQDLVWIGWPVYRAVEFGERAARPHAIWISDDVWKDISGDSNMTHSDSKPMWSSATETVPGGTFTVYKTNYRWPIG